MIILGNEKMKITIYKNYIRLESTVKHIYKSYIITYRDINFTIWKQKTTRWQRVMLIIKLIKWLI